MKNVLMGIYEKASIPLKYRIEKEIFDGKNTERLSLLKKELCKENKVRKIFNMIEARDKVNDFNGVHGATDYHLENSIPMAIQLGLDSDFEEFDEVVKPVIDRLKRKIFPVEHVFHSFIETIIIPFLYIAGYRETWITEHVKKRIEVLYDFTKWKDYDIYDMSTEYKGVPKAYRNRQVIKSELYEKGDFRFPLIYDIYLLGEVMKEADDKLKEKCETIVEYTLTAEYDKLHNGYGILYRGGNKYYAMGWDVKLPKTDDGEITSLMLQRLELLASFKCGRACKWFNETYKLANSYVTENGTFLFPKESLKDSNGVFVKGNRMSLGENRRKKSWREIESTFRMIKIKKIMER